MSAPHSPLSLVLRDLARVVRESFPGSGPIDDVKIAFRNGKKLQLPVFDGGGTGADAELTEAGDSPVGLAAAFVPNALQCDVLTALDGKALRTDALVVRIGCERSQLFKKPGGIQELREQGLVDNHPRVGYFRPDAPPAELVEQPRPA
jgi:hypothetical protein